MRDWAGSLKPFVDELSVAVASSASRSVFLVVGWVLIQVAGATFAPLGLPDWTLTAGDRAGRAELRAGLRTRVDLRPHDARHRAHAARTQSIADRAPVEAPAAPEASVAILPFTDLSEAHDQDYFCDGLAEEILNALGVDQRHARCVAHVVVPVPRWQRRRARDRPRAQRRGDHGRQRAQGRRPRPRHRAAHRRRQWLPPVVGKFRSQPRGHLRDPGRDRTQRRARAARDAAKRRGAGHRPQRASDVRAYEFYLRGRQMQVAEKHGDLAQRARNVPSRDRTGSRAMRRPMPALPTHWSDCCSGAWCAGRRARRGRSPRASARSSLRRTWPRRTSRARIRLSLAGENERATAEFERAIELNSELYEAHYYFARHCHCPRTCIRRALEEFEAAHRTRPDEFQALTLAARCRRRAGRRPARHHGLANRALGTGAWRKPSRTPKRTRALPGRWTTGAPGRYRSRPAQRRSGPAACVRDFGTLYNGACVYAQTGETIAHWTCWTAPSPRARASATGSTTTTISMAVRHLPRFKEIVAAEDAVDRSQRLVEASFRDRPSVVVDNRDPNSSASAVLCIALESSMFDLSPQLD